MQKTAIVTTLTNASKVLDSFLTYHFSIGFDHVFLFFDNPQDSSINIAETYNNVTIIKKDAQLRQKWEKAKTYKSVKKFIDEEIMARQILNVEIAVQLALEKDITWLLHIDVDELFYLPKGTLQQHLKFLTDYEIENIYYYNYEAVPEKVKILDYLKEVTLFKKSYFHLDKKQKQILNNLNDGNINLRFIAYGGGKSAAKVSNDTVPFGVHEFKPKRKYYLKEDGITTPQGPIILHYPECGFNYFWKKYIILGNFPDKWFGETNIAERVPFRIEARDIVQKNDKKLAKEFFKRKVMITGKQAIQQFINSGLLCRITVPSEIIEKERKN